MVLVLLSGCDLFGPGDQAKRPDAGDDDTAPAWPVEVTSYADRSDRQGVLEIPFEVTDPSEIVQVVVTSEKYVSTEYLYDPANDLVLDWEEWYSSRESLTEAFYPTRYATTLNWPVRGEDGPLAVGTWTVSIATLNSQGAYDGRADVEVNILRRIDPDFATGALHVLVAFAGDLAEDAEVAEAVHGAVDHWTEIVSAEGVVLTADYTSIDVDPELPDTYEGLDAYTDILRDQPERTLLVVVGDTIADDPALFGEAGGIPGPYFPTPAAAVEISWVTHAGGNGTFSEEEVLLMGETMAHETGHYMGLFHPVEDGFQYFDALDDTERCDSYSECEDALGTNLMYPYPVCTGFSLDTCVRQGDLTGEQSGTLHRYVGVEQP